MKLFIANTSEFLKIIDNSTIQKVYPSEKRNIEHNIGRLITKYIALNIYNNEQNEITTKDKKPCFKNSNLKFNISHSDKILGVVFSDIIEDSPLCQSEIGLDIEKFKTRDLTRLSDYFKKDFKSYNEFYKFWTRYEANYKSKLKNPNVISLKLKDYYISISYSSNQKFQIYKISPNNNTPNNINISLLNNENLKNLEFKLEKINTQEYTII